MLTRSDTEVFLRLRVLDSFIHSFAKPYILSYTQMFRSAEGASGGEREDLLKSRFKKKKSLKRPCVFNTGDVHILASNSTFFCSLPSEDVSLTFMVA